jgi:DNA recombination protein RmuC
MVSLLISLGVVNVGLAVGLLVLTLRRQPLDVAELAGRLHETERRLGLALEQVRAAHDAGLRQVLASTEAGRQQQTSAIAQSLARVSESVGASSREQAERSAEDALEQQELVHRLGAELQTVLHQRLDLVSTSLTALGDRLQDRSEVLRASVDARLNELRADNTEKLEKMRATVEEKLQSTLETRLGESFRTVSEQLEKVHKGLGEMQSLATGVGDLKRVLTNVKSRGTFGETQLSALLEDVLAPEQFEAQVVTRPGTDERVDFVVRLPGPQLGGPPVLLPIDAKFPVEDYLRLQQAQEASDPEAVLDAQDGLRQRLVTEAKSIAEKYLSSPNTTDFALLYLCTEGLYAEALRLGGLTEELSRKHHVTVVGPTTLAAFLSSLRAGFRTLAIQQRSSEVWHVLGAVKTEFGKFGVAIDAVSKKLHETTNKVDALSQRRRAVERTLSGVEQLAEPAPAGLLTDDLGLEAPDRAG